MSRRLVRLAAGLALAGALVLAGAAGARTLAPGVQVSAGDGFSGQAALSFDFKGLPFCKGTETQSVLEVRLKKGNTTVYSTASDGCRDDVSAIRLAIGWTDPDNAAWHGLSDGSNATLFAHQQRAGLYSYTWSVLWQGKVVRSGPVTVRVTVIPPHRIYRGTDDFQNYCKNEKQPIYSANGKLYCIDLRDRSYRFGPASIRRR